MSPQFITITLDPGSPSAAGGLSGVYYLAGPQRPVRSVELSVLWETEGAGDQDRIVHHFNRREAEDGAPPFDSDERRRFSITLPEGPHSYEGALIKVRWFVRARMVEEDGSEWTGELPFRFGATSPISPATAKE